MPTVITLTIPDEGDPQAIAEALAAQDDAIHRWNKFYWSATKRVKQYIKDTGPVRVNGGVFQLSNAKYKWNEEALTQEFPSLARHKLEVTLDTGEQAERAKSMLTEEFTYLKDEDVKVAVKVDGVLANSAIRTLEPERAERLLHLREVDGALRFKK